MIQFQKVSHRYHGDGKVISDVSLTINKGEFMALIGPSGAGKSTLLKMINRLVEPTNGRILVEGKDVKKENPVDLRRRIGYIIQQVGLFPHMTIWQNIALVPKLAKMPESAWVERVTELMEMIGLPLSEYGDRYPAQLSGGQQQRVGVVRAMAADPPILLMDEPFSALDPISREQLQDETMRIQRKYKKTIVLVTHDIDEALKLADRVCILKQGKILQCDTPEVLRSQPHDDFVRQFLGEERLHTVRSLTDVLVPAVTIRPDQRLWEGLQKMQRRRVDTLVVTEEPCCYHGVVTLWDLEAHRKDKTLPISQFMRKNYPSLPETADLATAVSTLHSQNLSCLPVLNSQGTIAGVLTRAGLVEMVADQLLQPNEGGESA